MSEEKKTEELNKEQLSSVASGEDGVLRHENEELIEEGGDLPEGLLDTSDLSTVSGGLAKDPPVAFYSHKELL